MLNKIVGFTISKSAINHEDVDLFQCGINYKVIKQNGFLIYLWGIGDFLNCKINEKYCLAFPLTDTLLDRNVTITFQEDKIIIENDWLGSIPVFYNKSNFIISTLCLKCLKSKDIHTEGLYNFLDFGYSVLEQTPFSEVKFLRYWSTLDLDQNGLNVQYKEDLLYKEQWSEHTKEKEVVNDIKHYINACEANTTGNIIIPTSGGYDSRLLNLLVHDKSRIRSYTYGVSDKQEQSSEVLYARKISEIYNTNWQQIELNHYYNYIPEWFKLYGFSTHLHGMYHIEFYKKVSSGFGSLGRYTLLSGIIGDAWSGKVEIPQINNVEDVNYLGYSHGLNADSRQVTFNIKEKSKGLFLEENIGLLQIPQARIVFSMRFKILLLSYLTSLPEYFGLPVWTPFLNYHIAISMLKLPPGLRKNRNWQKHLFSENSLNLESLPLKTDRKNTLNFRLYQKTEFDQINNTLLMNYLCDKYLMEINSIIENKKKFHFFDFYNQLFNIPVVGGILWRLSFRPKDYIDIGILSPYLTLKPLEMSLKQ